MKGILLEEVRIVPGFGVNIISGPYLERRLGMVLGGNVRIWSAKDKKGQVSLHGPADDAGLYWCKLRRLKRPTDREMSESEKGNPTHHGQKRFKMRNSGPPNHEWSPETETNRVRNVLERRE